MAILYSGIAETLSGYCHGMGLACLNKGDYSEITVPEYEIMRIQYQSCHNPWQDDNHAKISCREKISAFPIREDGGKDQDRGTADAGLAAIVHGARYAKRRQRAQDECLRGCCNRQLGLPAQDSLLIGGDQGMFIVLHKFSDNKTQASQFMEGHKAWIRRGCNDGV